MQRMHWIRLIGFMIEFKKCKKTGNVLKQDAGRRYGTKNKAAIIALQCKSKVKLMSNFIPY